MRGQGRCFQRNFFYDSVNYVVVIILVKSCFDIFAAVVQRLCICVDRRLIMQV